MTETDRSARRRARPGTGDGLDPAPLAPLSTAGLRAAAPLVLIHGFLMSNAVWRTPALDRLIRGRDAAALPLPGHASWPLTKGERRAVASGDGGVIARCAAALERAFERRPVDLVGHSAGALVALELAGRRPDLVRSVFTLGAVASGAPDGRANAMARLARAPLIGPLAARGALRWWLGGNTRFAAGLRTVSAPGRKIAGDRTALRRDAARCDPRALRAMLLWLLGRDLFEICPRVAAPTCLCLGRRDPVSPPEHQLRILRALPQGHAMMLEVGHLPMLEAPETVAEALAGWLSRPDAPDDAETPIEAARNLDSQAHVAKHEGEAARVRPACAMDAAQLAPLARQTSDRKSVV